MSIFFLAAFAVFDHLSPKGLPERHDPTAEPPPYIEFIKRAGENHRSMGFDGMLFPNYAGAAGVHDIRYITSLSVASFQEFRQRYLHPEDYHIFSLWFTGKDFKVYGKRLQERARDTQGFIRREPAVLFSSGREIPGAAARGRDRRFRR